MQSSPNPTDGPAPRPLRRLGRALAALRSWAARIVRRRPAARKRPPSRPPTARLSMLPLEGREPPG